MSQTIQAALPVRPAVLAVIALHAALVVALAMNFRYLVRVEKPEDIRAVYIPLPDDPWPEPDRRPIGPTSLVNDPPTARQPDVVMEEPAPDHTQLELQPPGDGISQPRPLLWARPLVVDRTDIPYPTERGVKPEGTVRLRLLIGIDGRPLEVVLGASSGHPSLDRAALKAVAHWRFKPRLLNGQPVESWAEMPIVFRLEN